MLSDSICSIILFTVYRLTVHCSLLWCRPLYSNRNICHTVFELSYHTRYVNNAMAYALPFLAYLSRLCYNVLLDVLLTFTVFTIRCIIQYPRIYHCSFKYHWISFFSSSLLNILLVFIVILFNSLIHSFSCS